MRLINTRTFRFKEFPGPNKPKYAILSHTWEEEEEVLFKDMSDPSHVNKKGYRKIEMTCWMAAQSNIEWAWIDTCCIDKSSSAELSQAINSMYRWYQRSEVCYVFLSDLPTSSLQLRSTLPNCRWFARGWTLQELIAPEKSLFFDRAWNLIGSKESLVEDISRITRINREVLLHSLPLSSVAVAQKMSWAAHRQTTLIEDIAYCLLGLFDVNMPLLYGEENKAFRRLQEEIIKSNSDLSILAWRLPRDGPDAEQSGRRFVCGFLAESPRAFAGCTSVTRDSRHSPLDLSMSNLGVKTRIQLYGEDINRMGNWRDVLPLYCSSAPPKILGIRLQRYGQDRFVREDPWNLVEDSIEEYCTSAPRERHFFSKIPDLGFHIDSFYIDMSYLTAHVRSRVIQILLHPDMVIETACPWSNFHPVDSLFFISDNSITNCCAMRFKKPQYENIRIDFDLLFIAVGWPTPMAEDQDLQCSLVDFKSYGKAFNEVDMKSKDWDYERREFVEQLTLHKIPKSSSATCYVQQLNAFLEVTFTPTLTSDPHVCRNPFWVINFHCQLLPSRYRPRPPVEESWIS
jgi:hypothetical protein